MSAIKPVGLSTSELARLASDFARGGMHFIKDDHGLVDQKTSPFAERLKACDDAVGEEVNYRSGGKASFVPNVTGPENAVLERAKEAQAAGAGAVMVAPALAGYDVVRALAADPDFALPHRHTPRFLRCKLGLARLRFFPPRLFRHASSPHGRGCRDLPEFRRALRLHAQGVPVHR